MTETRTPSGRLEEWVCEAGHGFGAVRGVPEPTCCPYVVHGQPCPEPVARVTERRR